MGCVLPKQQTKANITTISRTQHPKVNPMLFIKKVLKLDVCEITTKAAVNESCTAKME